MKPLPIPENRFFRFLYLMVQRYLRHRVGIQSAALAFYLLFSIFPFLIFISALLGLCSLLRFTKNMPTASQNPSTISLKNL